MCECVCVYVCIYIYIYIYIVDGSLDPIKSAQYVSRAGHTMVVKKKRLLEHCLYNAVS